MRIVNPGDRFATRFANNWRESFSPGWLFSRIIIISGGNLDGNEEKSVTERSFRHRGCNCADIMHVLGRVTRNCVRNDE